MQYDITDRYTYTGIYEFKIYKKLTKKCLYIFYFSWEKLQYIIK